MEIYVSTTFGGLITQNNFFARTIDQKGTKEYRGSYIAGEWKFKMYSEDKLILESQRITLTCKKTFFGHQSYKILWEGNEIGIVNSSYFKKELIFNGKSYPFPKLFKPSIDDLDLKFLFRTWIFRSSVKSNCISTEPLKKKQAIAMTVFVWIIRNAIPAD